VRLMVVSHPAVLPANQQFYADLEDVTGWELTLVVPRDWRHDYGQVLGGARWPRLRGRLEVVPVWPVGNIPLHIYRTCAKAVLERHGPDVLYVHHEPYALATVQFFKANRRWRRVPFGFYAEQNIAKRYPLPFRAWEREVLRGATFAGAVSQTALGILRDKGFAGRGELLPLGVDVEVYRPTPPPAALAELRRSRRLIGFVGRLSEEKGLDTLVRAVSLLPPDEPVVLVIVGDGPFAPSLDALVDDLGIRSKVVRVGYVPHGEVAAYYSAFDLLVLPSRTLANRLEQFGRVIIESLACGTPVIGSSSGEIPILIESLGGGAVFPEGDTAALASLIRDLLADPERRARLADAGRRAVTARYGNRVLAGRFAQVVESARVEPGQLRGAP
jgi:glycosyltransferase involved in cell wall biosynthesis